MAFSWNKLVGPHLKVKVFTFVRMVKGGAQSLLPFVNLLLAASCSTVMLTWWTVRNGDNDAQFYTASLQRHSWGCTRKVMEVVVWKMTKESVKEKLKSCILSYVTTPGQSLHEADCGCGIFNTTVVNSVKPCQFLPERKVEIINYFM